MGGRRLPTLAVFAALALPVLVAANQEPSASPQSAGEVGAERTGHERVVLLHGLGRTKRSMSEIAERLSDAGYQVFNLDYPSREKDPQALLELLAGQLESCCPEDSGTTHFVTYSLGGILVRAHLADRRPGNLGRVVMIAPPNQGSDVVDSLGDLWLFEKILGPTAVELGTEPGSLPNRLEAPDYELGVIAGNLSINPLGSWLVPGDDDGTVAVESTKIEGMQDFVVVPATHTFIPSDPLTVAEVLHFLANGRFSTSPPGTEADTAPVGDTTGEPLERSEPDHEAQR